MRHNYFYLRHHRKWDDQSAFSPSHAGPDPCALTANRFLVPQISGSLLGGNHGHGIDQRKTQRGRGRGCLAAAHHNDGKGQSSKKFSVLGRMLLDLSKLKTLRLIFQPDSVDLCSPVRIAPESKKPFFHAVDAYATHRDPSGHSQW